MIVVTFRIPTQESPGWVCQSTFQEISAIYYLHFPIFLLYALIISVSSPHPPPRIICIHVCVCARAAIYTVGLHLSCEIIITISLVKHCTFASSVWSGSIDESLHGTFFCGFGRWSWNVQWRPDITLSLSLSLPLLPSLSSHPQQLISPFPVLRDLTFEQHGDSGCCYQLSEPMAVYFRSLLQTFLKRSVERPTGRYHMASSSRKRPFCIWPLFIRGTWPRHRRQRWQRRKYVLQVSASLCCRRRQRRGKLSRRFSC